MSDVGNLLWYIVALPLVGAALCAMMSGRRLRAYSHLPCVLGAAGAAAISLIVLLGLLDSTGAFDTTSGPVVRTGNFVSPAWTWFEVGPVKVEFKLNADTLTGVMLFVITFVGTWIVIFSIGYMRGESGYARYFALVSLFLFSMSLLVLADNFVLLFFGWEGVGLCSYLLVGYWYAKPSAAAAARKAFLVTRLGDVGMILGIFLFWSIGGHRFDFEHLFVSVRSQVLLNNDPSWVALACLLLFCGAVGKSAQLPLYVWLPDAMEGPTPISALIHAATMVTAGVYLLARCAPLFVLSPEVQLTVAIIGGATALLAAYIALTQYDLKRVLAYSTVSQLGFMFLALGAAGPAMPSIAVTAAIFHLLTHAFFKAVLFLSAGSVMHAMGGVIDMRRFGGLRKVLPITHLTFLCGAAALAGLPLLSGFWSKDQILESTREAAHADHYATVYLVLFWVAMFTALLTAFYTFRAYFLTFWGETKIPPDAEDHGHGHAGPREEAVMTLPLVVLAIGALGIGALVALSGTFNQFLLESDSLKRANGERVMPAHHVDWILIVESIAVAVGGLLLAWWVYYRRPGTEEEIARRAPRAYQLSLNRLYVDELYEAIFVRPLTTIASICRAVESLIYDLVRLVAALPRGVAELLRPMQNGLVQFYGLAMTMGLAAFLFYLVFWAGR